MATRPAESTFRPRYRLGTIVGLLVFGGGMYLVTHSFTSFATMPSAFILIGFVTFFVTAFTIYAGQPGHDVRDVHNTISPTMPDLPAPVMDYYGETENLMIYRDTFMRRSKDT